MLLTGIGCKTRFKLDSLPQDSANLQSEVAQEGKGNNSSCNLTSGDKPSPLFHRSDSQIIVEESLQRAERVTVNQAKNSKRDRESPGLYFANYFQTGSYILYAELKPHSRVSSNDFIECDLYRYQYNKHPNYALILKYSSQALNPASVISQKVNLEAEDMDGLDKRDGIVSFADLYPFKFDQNSSVSFVGQALRYFRHHWTFMSGTTIFDLSFKGLLHDRPDSFSHYLAAFNSEMKAAPKWVRDRYRQNYPAGNESKMMEKLSGLSKSFVYGYISGTLEKSTGPGVGNLTWPDSLEVAKSLGLLSRSEWQEFSAMEASDNNYGKLAQTVINNWLSSNPAIKVNVAAAIQVMKQLHGEIQSTGMAHWNELVSPERP
jgi:hypothetical protein